MLSRKEIEERQELLGKINCGFFFSWKYTTQRIANVQTFFVLMSHFIRQLFLKTNNASQWPKVQFSSDWRGFFSTRCRKSQADSLFRNKRFALNKMFQRNASKFSIFYVYENPRSFFRFSFRATLYFYLMNALVQNSRGKIVQHLGF